MGKTTISRYYTKSEACHAAYVYQQHGNVWDSPYEHLLGGSPTELASPLKDLNFDK